MWFGARAVLRPLYGHGGEFVQIDVAAGDDGDYFACAGATAERRGDGAGGGSFDDRAVAFGDGGDGAGGVAQRDDDGAIEQFFRQREHVGEDHLAADAIDEGRFVLDGSRFAGRERGSKRRGGFDLSGIDADFGRERAQYGRDAAGQAAAAP